MAREFSTDIFSTETVTVSRETIFNVFIVYLIAHISYYLYLTTQFRTAASRWGPYIVGVTAIVVLILALVFHNDVFGISDRLSGDAEEEESALLSRDDQQKESLESDGEQVRFIGLVQQLVWVIVYLFGVVNVGYFTSTVVFLLAYTLAHYEPESLQKRIGVSIGITVGITAFLWILYIELLSAISLYRIGPFI